MQCCMLPAHSVLAAVEGIMLKLRMHRMLHAGMLLVVHAHPLLLVPPLQALPCW
jgi:hypothetical protein